MLTSSQQRVLELAARAVRANPFSDERDAIDRELSGAPAGTEREAMIDMALVRVREVLGELDPSALGRAESDAAREVMLHAHLFSEFHACGPEFNEFIQAQIVQGSTNLSVPFAVPVLDRLRSLGLSGAQALRYFGIFYQMRRAYFFLHTSLPGQGRTMRAFRARLWANLFTHDLALYERVMWDRMEDFSTFLIGETGSGKGTAAAALGRSGWIPFEENSGRFESSFPTLFLPTNLSQYTETLLESELFGHRKGAFTGAIGNHHGLFERCPRHGVIFLDEIGELAGHVQIKLLRVLQEREFEPVGGMKPVRFWGRVVAATNRTMTELRAGRLRDDLFYRLCSDVLEAPPLRVRLAEDPEELRTLLEHIVSRTLGTWDDGLVGELHDLVHETVGPDYAWPGNVRELEQCVRRLILTRSYAPMAAQAGELAAMKEAVEMGRWTVKELTAAYCKHLHGMLGTYEAVAERTGLDRRTVKKYVKMEL